MNYRFKVKDLIEVCGDMYICITDNKRVNADGTELIHWQGWTGDECPYGDYEVKHIASWGTMKKSVECQQDNEKREYNVLYIQIEKENCDFAQTPIYVWKCSKSQFDDAYYKCMQIINHNINYLMDRSHFAQSASEVQSYYEQSQFWEKDISNLINEISEKLNDKFDKEIDRNMTIKIYIPNEENIYKARDVLSLFLNGIDCMYAFDETTGILYIRPSINLSYKLVMNGR